MSNAKIKIDSLMIEPTMIFETNKAKVLQLFESHILRYVIKDLEVLDSISPDALGAGGCTIPQAISTFASLDLIGFLTHPQEIKTVNMCFTDLLKNESYFPDLKLYSTQEKFFDSFRENVRSIMVHRFSLSKYDIAKIYNNDLFIRENGREIFNISFFTKMTIGAIRKIHHQIRNDTYFINGYSKELTMEKMANRIEKLKNFASRDFLNLPNLLSATTNTETTRSLG